MTQFKIETEVLFPGLIHVHFDTQYEVASTFLRLQEFYESPYLDINGKYFTLEQYMDTYAREMGNFTYTSDWSGFNVPGEIVDNFYETFKGNLLKKEQTLYSTIHRVHELNWNKYYVIASSDDGGTHDSPKDVMKHEIAHGMWYLNDEYNAAQRAVVHQVLKENVCIGKKLIKMGYKESVIDDEIHAYFATSNMVELADKTFKKCDIPWEYVLQCQRIFKKYYKKITEKDSGNV